VTLQTSDPSADKSATGHWAVQHSHTHTCSTFYCQCHCTRKVVML